MRLTYDKLKSESPLQTIKTHQQPLGGHRCPGNEPVTSEASLSLSPLLYKPASDVQHRRPGLASR